VGGGLDDGSENAALVPELARQFTVFNYARRGRGDSGDIRPYALEREIEDIDALISEAGGSAHLFGASSGGALALEAAAAGLAIDRIAVYEVPYMDNDVAAQQWSEYVTRLTAALADGRRGDAIELFMRLAGSSDEDIAGARASSFWPGLEALCSNNSSPHDADSVLLGNETTCAAFLALAAATVVIAGRAGNAGVMYLNPGVC
jgi:pimeloyl-ACP methyl ester carboxylesterase